MTGIKVCIITILLTLFYLIVSILLSNILFYRNANGSLIKANDKVVGSKLIGQEFKSNIYFHGRPSLYNYKNDISGNSNFPFFSHELRKNINNNLNDFLKTGNKPDLNLISESASGLDPDITYEGALSQLDRVSKNTHIKKEELKELIEKKAKHRILNLFGPKIVNVLELNLEVKKNAKTPGS